MEQRIGYMEKIHNDGQRLEAKVIALSKENDWQKVDRILTALELVGALYHQELVMYHTRRYQVITQLERYYQTLSVEPIWSENDNLLYRVKIRLIHDEQFLQYVIQTVPVPYQNSTISAQ